MRLRRVRGRTEDDCLRASLATLLRLDYDETPTFKAPTWGHQRKAVQRWLAKRGLTLVTIAYRKGMLEETEVPGFALGGVWRRPEAHMVVMRIKGRKARIWHDPHRHMGPPYWNARDHIEDLSFIVPKAPH